MGTSRHGNVAWHLNQHKRHDVAFAAESSLDLPPQPICRVTATLQGRRRQQNKKMRPCGYVSEDDVLEITTVNAVKFKEQVIPVLCQVLENSQRPRDVGPAIAEKNGLLHAFHTGAIDPVNCRNSC